jgi:hypothetical protein
MEGVNSTRKQIEDALKSVTATNPPSEYRRFREFASLYLGIDWGDGASVPPASNHRQSIV